MGFLFVFCSNKSKTFPGQVGRVVLQRPSDGTNSLVTSRLILQPRYVLLHRPSRSTQACGHPAPRAAEPGKKAPVLGVRARDIYGRTQKGMGSFSQEERGTLPSPLPQNSAFRPGLLKLCVQVLEASVPSTHASSYCAGMQRGRRETGLLGG